MAEIKETEIDCNLLAVLRPKLLDFSHRSIPRPPSVWMVGGWSSNSFQGVLQNFDRRRVGSEIKGHLSVVKRLGAAWLDRNPLSRLPSLRP